jgi:Zn-dependent protease
MQSLTIVQTLAVWLLPVIFAITFREIARGYAARALGDNTATQLKQLSLNPLNHVDPVGTLLIPGIILVARAMGMNMFLIGWAKPIPIDWRQFKNPRRDLAIVAAVGPLTNFALAILFAFILKFAAMTGSDEGVAYGLQLMGQAGIAINLSLMIINLLPLPPLDGGRMLQGLLPPHAAYQLSKVEPYTSIIVLLLLITGVLGALLQIPYGLALLLLRAVVGI